MSCSDPISDFLTCIRNANQMKFEKVDVPASKLKEEIAKLLRKEGYIKNYKKIEDHKQGVLRVYLKYDEQNQTAINGLQRISKPGRRIYYKHDELPTILQGMGIVVVSTSKGIMIGQQAKKQKLGGEALCSVW